ncbi:MAG: GNAT family N-acetyltransferase [Planctomycetes bacterium]|nr:GNAT family N-acetyltransferase [Planctomycetota bacterium]
MKVLSSSPELDFRPQAARAGTRLDWKVITHPGELEGLAPSWRALLQDSACNEPVLSPAWMLAWWKVFGPVEGRQLRTACFFRGGRLVGLAPLLGRPWWHRPGIPFRRLEMLGTGELPRDASYPEYLSVLAERGAEEEVAAALVEALTGQELGAWDELILAAMDQDHPMLAGLAGACRTAGLIYQVEPAGSAPFIPLPATWEAYLEELSSSGRAFVRKSLRRFEEWAGDRARCHAVTDPANLEEGKRILIALHQERWGHEAGKFASARFTAFHEAVLASFLREGAAELLWLSVQGEPVAAAYNLVWNGKVYFYQGGRKLDVPSGQRPGIVLHAHAIRRAIEAGRREYDFLGGGDHYKKQMALAARPLVQVRVARPGLVEWTRVLTEKGFGWARAVRRAARAAGGWLGRKEESHA